MSETTQSFGYYLKSSKKEMLKAILLGLLLCAGLFIAIILRLNNIDGVSIFTVGILVVILETVAIYFLSKKGFIYVLPREDEFEQHGPKKTRKKIED
jgi:ABC-type transport system involved in cytochrome c biogenesis permease subunit